MTKPQLNYQAHLWFHIYVLWLASGISCILLWLACDPGWFELGSVFPMDILNWCGSFVFLSSCTSPTKNQQRFYLLYPWVPPGSVRSLERVSLSILNDIFEVALIGAWHPYTVTFEHSYCTQLVTNCCTSRHNWLILVLRISFSFLYISTL